MVSVNRAAGIAALRQRIPGWGDDMIDPTASVSDRTCPEGPSATPLQVLIVEDNDADAFIITEMVARARGLSAEVERVGRLDAALARLADGGIDLVLLDLSLPDSRGFETFTRLHLVVPDIPVVVMSASDDEELAIASVRHGAQDYLVKGQATAEALSRAIRYGLERHRLLMALRGLSLVDDLTGLYNRRGFFTLAEGHIQLARRSNRRFVLVFGDLDGLKQVNDTYGHKEGDVALVMCAQVLRATFRQTDIIARLGGDEFAVLAVETATETEQLIARRLERAFEEFNAESSLPYKVHLTCGMVPFEAGAAPPLADLLHQADAQLYARKKGRRSSLEMKVAS